MRVEYQRGGLHSGQYQMLGLPDEEPDGTVPGILWLHGSYQFANDASSSPEAGAIFNLLAESGFPVLSFDGGDLNPDIHGGIGGLTSSNHWGNPNGVSEMLEAITWLQTPRWLGGGGAKPGPVHIFAISMGNVLNINFGKQYPDKVISAVSLVGLVAMEIARETLGTAFQQAIDEAWGVTYPTPLPAGADPYTDYIGYINIPYRAYYSVDDTTVVPSTTLSMASKLEMPAIDLGPGGHSAATFGHLPLKEVLNFYMFNTHKASGAIR